MPLSYRVKIKANVKLFIDNYGESPGKSLTVDVESNTANQAESSS